MHRLPLLFAITTLLSCSQTPLQNQEPVKPTLETGPGPQEPAITVPETPTKEPLPEPWVFKKQFEGKLERWVRGAREVNFEKTEYFGCGYHFDALCSRQKVLAVGTINREGRFSVPLSDELIRTQAFDLTWACGDKRGFEFQKPIAKTKSVAIEDVFIAISGVKTGRISDLPEVSDSFYPSTLGNKLILLYTDHDQVIQGFCQGIGGAQYKTNLNLQKGWNLTKQSYASNTFSRWLTPSRDDIQWHYNPYTIHLKVDSPTKMLRIGESMSGVSLKLVDTDPVLEVPNIQQFSLKDSNNNWEFSQSTLKAKRLGYFSPEISSNIDGIQYNFRADSDNSIYMHGIEAFGGSFNTGDPSTAKTLVRFTGREEQRTDMVFKAGDQVEIIFPDASKFSSTLEATSNFQQLILPRPVMVGLYRISVNGSYSYEFKINGKPSKGFEKSVFVFPTEQPEIMIENRSGYPCSSDSFRISLTDLTNNQV